MAATLPRKLWEHPDPQSTEMYKFMQTVNQKHKLNLKTFWELYQWSINNRSTFWTDVFECSPIIHTGSIKRVVDETKLIDEVPKWFEGVQLSFAENILWSRGPSDPSDFHGTAGKEDDKVALTEVREGVSELRDVTWATLRQTAARFASALHALSARPAYVDGHGHAAIQPYLPVRPLSLRLLDPILGPPIRWGVKGFHSPTEPLGRVLAELAIGKHQDQFVPAGKELQMIGQFPIMENSVLRRLVGI
ncbi:hypothetical protein G7054_g11257 [Neopestalotiopsis clavispora]|nr:hypothetical protein G7054_g11257 [Neopestalotiopsis clavispora]